MFIAYVSDNGVAAIEDTLKTVAHKLTIIVGCQNKITSVQAVKRLVKLGCTVHVFNTGSPHSTFHYKILLRKGKETNTYYAGSGNLTWSALSENFEAGDYITFSHDQEQFMNSFNTYLSLFDTLKTDYKGNILAIRSQEDADEIARWGWLENTEGLVHAAKMKREREERTNVTVQAEKIKRRQVRGMKQAKNKKAKAPLVILSAGDKAIEALRQPDLYAPIMEMLYLAPNQTLPVKTLKAQIIQNIQLKAGDQETLPSQKNRSRIHKTFENVISHRNTTTSPIYDGLIIYDKERSTMTLTPKGQKHRLENPYVL